MVQEFGATHLRVGIWFGRVGSGGWGLAGHALGQRVGPADAGSPTRGCRGFLQHVSVCVCLCGLERWAATPALGACQPRLPSRPACRPRRRPCRDRPEVQEKLQRRIASVEVKVCVCVCEPAGRAALLPSSFPPPRSALPLPLARALRWAGLHCAHWLRCGPPPCSLLGWRETGARKRPAQCRHSRLRRPNCAAAPRAAAPHRASPLPHPAPRRCSTRLAPARNASCST